MLTLFRELRDYAAVVEKAVTNITVCAALAEAALTRGQTVYLKMKDGLLYASPDENGGARGTAISSVEAGEDVDVADIEGLVPLIRGHITILQVPVVREGGSRQIDTDRLREHMAGTKETGAIGIEALVSMQRAGLQPRYLYGVTEAAIEAAQCGLPFTIVCTEDAIPGLIKHLQEENIPHSLTDLHR
jgi:putative transcriptional regulator